MIISSEQFLRILMIIKFYSVQFESNPSGVNFILQNQENTKKLINYFKEKHDTENFTIEEQVLE